MAYPPNDGAAQLLNGTLLIPICTISNYALAFNTCPLKQKCYGVATITDQDTIQTVP